MPNDKQSRAELVERLRGAGDFGAQTTNDVMNLCNEAASAIKTLEAENARMREALLLAQKWLANSVPVVEIDGPFPLPVIHSALNPERSEK